MVGLGNTRQALDAPIAFIDACLDVDCGVELAGLAP